MADPSVAAGNLPRRVPQAKGALDPGRGRGHTSAPERPRRRPEDRMSHTPHELAEMIHERKATDAHFARLADDYHALNREIHRAETDVQPTSEPALEDMKKRRLALLDEIRAMLAA